MTDDLNARVAALEAAISALQSSPPAGPPPAVPRPDGPGDYWVLGGIRDRHPDGAVYFAGTVRARSTEASDAGDPVGEIAWQWGVVTDQVRDQEWEAAAPIFDALSHPVRLRLLQQVLNGTATTAELAEDGAMGTTGQLHHHLRALTAAGWLTSVGRGHWAVPGPRVVPLLVMVTAATA